jgi:ElaB/YqjD/DUF883 family membrane-anchored ribosome-binding protein
MNEAASKDMEALRAELEKLRTDFSSMGKAVKDLANDMGSNAYAKMHDASDRARVRAERAAETVTETIGERPLTSVLTAFVLGLLLGVLFGRQR